MPQICKTIYADVPFWNILILKINILIILGHATLCAFLIHSVCMKTLTRNMLTKYMKRGRRRNRRKCYHLLSFLLSSSKMMIASHAAMTLSIMWKFHIPKLPRKIRRNVIILLSLLLITFFTTVAPPGAFF